MIKTFKESEKSKNKVTLFHYFFITYNFWQIHFFFLVDPKNFEGPFGVFWAEKFFVSEFDETWYIDAPYDGDHFIIKKIFWQMINKHVIHGAPNLT